MGIEQVTYADLAERLNISAEAARSLVRRKQLSRQTANDGKTLVAVDFSDIRHKAVPVVRRADLEVLRARVAELEELVKRVEAIAAWHRKDYERERERAEQLVAEIVRMFADLVAAKEKAARLEAENAALRARPWWLRLGGYNLRTQYAVADARCP
jgi:predicted nuclease with TOPRIM domain